MKKCIKFFVPYEKYCKDNGLNEKPDRLTVEWYRAKAGKMLDNCGGSGIINENNKRAITPISDKAIENVQAVGISGYTKEQCKLMDKSNKNAYEGRQAE